MKLFDDLIRQLRLVNPKLNNGQFTWSDFRHNPICCRLDKFLLSNKWHELFQEVRQEVLVRIVSDNHPIVLDSYPIKGVQVLFALVICGWIIPLSRRN